MAGGSAPGVVPGFVKLVVSDMAAMVDFYRDAFGFEVQREIDLPDIEETVMAAPGSKGRFSLVLFRWKDGRAITVGNGHGPVGLMTRDVEASYAHAIENGGKPDRPPFELGTMKLAFLHDPEGHEIELMTAA